MALNLNKAAKALANRRAKSHLGARKMVKDTKGSTESQKQWYQRSLKRVNLECDQCGAGTYKTQNTYDTIRRQGREVLCPACIKANQVEAKRIISENTREFNQLMTDYIIDMGPTMVEVDIYISDEWEDGV